MSAVQRVQRRFLLLFLLLLIPAGLLANPFPRTSYEVLGKRNLRPYPADVLFVLIDQSVNYDTTIRNKAYELVGNWLAEGRAVEIYSFSSAVPGKYTMRITGGRIDDVPTDYFLDNLKRSERELFQTMHPRQRSLAKRVVLNSMYQAFSGSRQQIQRTDIVRTMKELSGYIKGYPASRKSVLLVSDMMENSQLASFYFNGRVRMIDPERELQKVAARGMIADFGGNLRVYVLGLGYFGEDKTRPQSENYLDSDRINSISTFWYHYFVRSRAVVAEIGKPMMFGTIY